MIVVKRRRNTYLVYQLFADCRIFEILDRIGDYLFDILSIKKGDDAARIDTRVGTGNA